MFHHQSMSLVIASLVALLFPMVVPVLGTCPDSTDLSGKDLAVPSDPGYPILDESGELIATSDEDGLEGTQKHPECWCGKDTVQLGYWNDKEEDGQNGDVKDAEDGQDEDGDDDENEDDEDDEDDEKDMEDGDEAEDEDDGNENEGNPVDAHNIPVGANDQPAETSVDTPSSTSTGDLVEAITDGLVGMLASKSEAATDASGLENLLPPASSASESSLPPFYGLYPSADKSSAGKVHNVTAIIHDDNGTTTTAEGFLFRGQPESSRNREDVKDVAVNIEVSPIIMTLGIFILTLYVAVVV